MSLRACFGAMLLGALSLLTGCETILPPLRGEIEVGQEAYAVFVGGEDAHSDLYALAPGRGLVLPITYTAVAELAPSLSPDGMRVALLRAATLRDSVPGTAWVLQLRTGDEHELVLPPAAGAPRRVGWARAGDAVFVAADSRIYRFDAPFRRRKPRVVTAGERAAVDSTFAVLLGDPVIAEAVVCDGGGSVCVKSAGGAAELLARDARDPVRWGRDSVGYFIRDRLELRPLGPGRTRLVNWTNPPRRPRAMTYFPGQRPGPPR